MKKTGKILLSIAVTMILIIIVIHFVLQAKIGTIINDAVVPKVEQALNIDVDVGGISLNLLGGSLRLSDVKLGNPDKFSEPTIFSMDKLIIDLGVMSTIGGLPEVTKARIDDAVITIVRNNENKINAKQISDSLPSPEPSDEQPEVPDSEDEKDDDTAPSAPATQQPGELPKLVIKDASIDTMLEYIDYKLRDEVTRIALRASITAKDLTTVGGGDQRDGSIIIAAHLDGKPDLYVTNIEAAIKPIVDPAKPSFVIDGSIAAIDLTQPEMASIWEKAGVQADSASLRVHVKSVDGSYQQPESVITIILKNCRAAGSVLAKNPDMPIIPELSISIPVKQTVSAPDFGDIQSIIGNALLQNLANNPEILKDLLMKQMKKGDSKDGSETDDRLQKEVDRGLKKFGKFLDKL